MGLHVTLNKKINSLNELSNREMSEVYNDYSNYLRWLLDNEVRDSFEDYFFTYKLEIYSGGTTHNLTKMAEEAGLYDVLWRPYKLIKGYKEFDEDKYDQEMQFEQLLLIYAKDLIEPLERGLMKLKAGPEYYKKFDSENGWGLYKNFVPFVENYLNACLINPDAIVDVDR